ncbi:hypothetical protein TNIN_213251 [Trichonephila inaurata madagascariensis]|uniref:BTB domain-containing protein n=1 Tax=Trichonephila inaurata madagascariensis TaxID=2747483 RepID=A0A8X7CD72_9ARAC|nr:hypothetical protein TNIN_213251 [Trichonephila inaurata madagascariensis]
MTTSMDTDLPLPTTSDFAKCERMLTIHESILLLQDRLLTLESALMRIHTGKIRKRQPDYDNMVKDADDLTRHIESLKGTIMTHTFKPSPVHGAGATLFMNEHCSDITIIITEDCTVWRFPAHSTVLAAQSIVFHRMLDSDFIEKKTQEIVLQDMTPSTLKKLLRYMYLGDAILEDWKEAIELLKAAHKYQMESLVQKCAHFLQEHIDLSNVCYIYSKAVTYTLSPLGNICLEIILGTGCIVLRSQGFEYLNKESVMAVISSYSLNVDGEMCVVNALLRWAVMECCRQNKPLTEESIVEIMVPFRKYLCTRSINSDEMHTLPHFLHAEINSYHSRQSFCVTQHLLDYAKRVSLQLIDLDCLADNVSNFTCFRFLADHSLFLISVHLVTVTSFLTSNNYVGLVSESGNSNTPVFELNLAEVTEITTSLPGASSKPMFETEVLLKRPVLLQPQTVYRLSLRSNSRSLKPSQCHIQFPKTGLVPSKVGSRSDIVPFTILTDSIWGVTKLMYLTAPVPEKEIFKFRLQK